MTTVTIHYQRPRNDPFKVPRPHRPNRGHGMNTLRNLASFAMWTLAALVICLVLAVQIILDLFDRSAQ